MLFARPLVFLILLFTANLLSGCSSPAGNSNQAQTSGNASNAANAAPKDNVEEFADIVRLPFVPEEVAWKETPTKGITAVVRFSPEDAQKMSAEVAKNGQAATESLTVESWYPTELIAQSEMTGESTIKGQSYPAESFLNPPYKKGKITRIEGTDYFILQISS